MFLAVNRSKIASAVQDLGPWNGRIVIDANNPIEAPDFRPIDPGEHGGRRVLFVAGDDAGAKGEVVQLIGRLGFAAIDLGALAEGGRLAQFPGGPLPGLNLALHQAA